MDTYDAFSFAEDKKILRSLAEQVREIARQTIDNCWDNG